MDYSMDFGLVASSWRHVGKSGEKGKGRKLHFYMHPVACTCSDACGVLDLQFCFACVLPLYS